jgi:hypothetical protein
MKKLILILVLISSKALAVEVTTLSVNKNAANEMTLVSTDESFLTAIDKHFMARNCKLRNGVNFSAPIKEMTFPNVCRAEVIQFLLNNNFRADPYFLTFTK